jgi:hypothetical protein
MDICPYPLMNIHSPSVHALEISYRCLQYILSIRNLLSITEAMWSNVWTVLALSNTGVVSLVTTRGMDISMWLLCICIFLCVVGGFAKGWMPIQAVLPTVYKIKKLWKTTKAQQRALGLKRNSMVWVRKRTIPIERPPLVGEVSANFCGYRVPRG